MIKCTNWILLDRYKEDRAKYEEYTSRVTKDKIQFASLKTDDDDKNILRLIHKLKVCTSRQVSKIIFRDEKHPIKKCNNKLKKLYELGCIDRFFPAVEKGSPQTHLVLAPIGAHLIEARKFRKIFSLNQNWRHQVFTNEVLAELSNKYEVTKWRGELVVEWINNNKTQTIRSDAFCGWEDGFEKYAMFEIDLSTEHMDELKSKVKQYHNYFNSTEFVKGHWQPKQPIIPFVIFVFEDKERANNLHKYVRRFNSNVPFKVMTFDNMQF
jgi:hypothetical protein